LESNQGFSNGHQAGLPKITIGASPTLEKGLDTNEPDLVEFGWWGWSGLDMIGHDWAKMGGKQSNFSNWCPTTPMDIHWLPIVKVGHSKVLPCRSLADGNITKPLD